MKEIIIENLCKSFEEHSVLRNFNARIGYGTSLCVAGPSGCGKTTLLRIMMGLENPDSGTVQNLPKSLSAVFQEDRLCRDFTVLSNVRIAATCRDAECRELITELGLQEYIGSPVCELSGGQRRRVAIARCLAHEAELYILDEPLTRLDAETAEKVMGVIEKHTHGKTVVIAAHAPVRQDRIKTEYLT